MFCNTSAKTKHSQWLLCHTHCNGLHNKGKYTEIDQKHAQKTNVFISKHNIAQLYFILV